MTQSIGETAHIQAVILQNDYLTKVAAAVYGIEIPGHPFRSWIQEFKRGNIDVFVALLLSQLPALENLNLGYGYLHRATFLPTMLQHLAFHRHTTFFPNLPFVTMAADPPPLTDRVLGASRPDQAPILPPKHPHHRRYDDGARHLRLAFPIPNTATRLTDQPHAPQKHTEAENTRAPTVLHPRA